MRSIDSWLDRFAYKHPRFGIPHLMTYIIIANSAIFLLDLFSNGLSVSSLLGFQPMAILQGEVWRLVTFILVPETQKPIWFVVSMFFYYFLGNLMEREWGAAKFTLFYLCGALLTLIAGFIGGFFMGTMGYAIAAPTITMYQVNLSLFLAFATLYPDTTFLIYFIIPVKAKLLERGGDRRLFRLAGLFQCFQHHSVLSCFPSGASAASVCSASEAAACPSA